MSPLSLATLRSSLGRVAREISRVLGRSLAGELRVRLAADDEVARAHERYLDVPGTTDVITFDLTEGGSASGEPIDADLLLCVDEARRQAERRAISLERELLLYATHGLLHCLGEDDHDPAGHDRMHAFEDRLLESIGVGATFSHGAAPRGTPMEN